MSKPRLMIGLSAIAILFTAGITLAQVEYTKEHGGYKVRSVDRFDVSPGGKLSMKDLIGDVRIQGGNGTQVEVIQLVFLDENDEADARKAFERYRADITKSGNTIQVKGPSLSFMRHVPNISYEIKLPAQFDAGVSTSGGDVDLSDLTGTVDLSTSGGDVEIASVKGPVDASTSGGNVTARNLEGTATLKTAGGDVKLSDSKIGPFSLKTAGGDITLQGVKGNAAASTAGGDVQANEVEGNLELRTSGGEILLQSVKGTNHSASTSGGDVEARDVEGSVDLKTSGGQVTAIRIKGDVYGRTSGGDMEIEDITGNTDISTSGGSLRIIGVAGRLAGATSGGDVEASLRKNSPLTAPIRLSTSGGRMVMELPADVKASIYAEVRLQSSDSDHTIRSDFNLKIEEEGNGRGLSGTRRTIIASGDINGGGPLIELKTVEGDIYIQKTN
ncbi:MAG: DUF4097 family beta strand repeat-containing protein [bacterium]|nr:DUF4097 family beta strand repeat-containing protein [bacterium]